MTYHPLTTSAGNVGTDVATLMEFGQAGWIKMVSKNGQTFVSGQDEYRSKFILVLRSRLKLTDKQIEIVLEDGKAPYSLDQVPAILARHAAQA